MNRCTGHCCESFWLPMDPNELQFQAKLAKIGKSRWNQKDCIKVAEMVIYQRPNDHNKPGFRYTCKYFDSVSKNCTNYENRPKMCSAFPYDKQCEYKACTYKPEAEIEYDQKRNGS